MDVNEAIKKRRAYRSIERIELSEDLMYDLVNYANLAPSCKNSQPWRFIFVSDDGQLKRLFKILSPGNKWVEMSSLLIGVFSRFMNDCVIKERMYYLFDTGLASAFLILRATELGFVAHPIAGFEEAEAKRILNIPNDMRLISFIIIGKKSNDVNPVLTESMVHTEKMRPPRNNIKELVFFNIYKK